MCRQAISDSHWSHDDQVRHVMTFLESEFPRDWAYILECFSEYPTLVWLGAWVDTDASGVDPDYMAWLCDAIEQDSPVFWQDGEPWIGDNYTCGNDHLSVCADCYVVSVNGDTSGISDPIRGDKVLLGLERYAQTGRHLVGTDEYDGSFSWSSCDLCGDHHGGTRYEMVGI